MQKFKLRFHFSRFNRVENLKKKIFKSCMHNIWNGQGFFKVFPLRKDLNIQYLKKFLITHNLYANSDKRHLITKIHCHIFIVTTKYATSPTPILISRFSMQLATTFLWLFRRHCYDDYELSFNTLSTYICSLTTAIKVSLRVLFFRSFLRFFRGQEIINSIQANRNGNIFLRF